MNPEEAKTKREQKNTDWNMARDAIKHEDQLVNIRLTWLINIHWFLFGGFGVIQGALIAARPGFVPILLVQSVVVLFFYIAIRMCEALGQAIDMASAHIAHVKEWWSAKYPEEWLPPREVPKAFLLRRPRVLSPLPPGALDCEYPPVCGDFGFRHDTGAWSIPHILARIDVLIICCCFAFLGVSHYVSDRPTSRLEMARTTKDKKEIEERITIQSEFQGDLLREDAAARKELESSKNDRDRVRKRLENWRQSLKP
jgi:hypothetical protein